MSTISVMIHMIAAAVLVGPQVLMFYAVTPATWMIEDEAMRGQIVKVVAGRFARLSIIAILVLLATGLYQYYTIVPDSIQDDMFAYRFGELFVTKMTLVTLLVVMVAVHGAVLGRRIRRLSDAVIAGTGDVGRLEAARGQSLVFSGAMVIVSLGILMLGAALGHHEYSFIER